MKIIRVLTSILLLVVYLLPISLEASDFFMRLNECEQETSCCEIEVEKSCCNTKPTPKIIEKQHSECTDSILCQCCIENCNYQKSSHSPKNIGFNVININSLNIIKPIE